MAAQKGHDKVVDRLVAAKAEVNSATKVRDEARADMIRRGLTRHEAGGDGRGGGYGCGRGRHSLRAHWLEAVGHGTLLESAALRGTAGPRGGGRFLSFMGDDGAWWARLVEGLLCLCWRRARNKTPASGRTVGSAGRLVISDGAAPFSPPGSAQR
jgi:hypothetical protein